MGTVIFVTFPMVGTSSKCGPYLVYDAIAFTHTHIHAHAHMATTTAATMVVVVSAATNDHDGGNNRIKAIACM